MACYHPIPAWRSQQVTGSGKLGVTFRRREGTPSELEIPCGQCIGCRLERSRVWALRCHHEARLYSQNSFITLTYQEPPPGGSLRPQDFTDFMKRLRYHYGEVRYFQCGEYGEKLSRPHHHALLFGVWFDDCVRLNRLSRDNPLWTSASLERMWGHGLVSIGEVTFESAAYVARYCVKKRTGDGAQEHYNGKVPEYVTMSRRPGIGRQWILKYHREVYDQDEVRVNARTACKPARYYDQVIFKTRPDLEQRIKNDRKREARLSTNNKGTRLTVREHIATQRNTMKGARNLE